MCWNLPAILSNTVDIFRGLTNKKKPKYNGIRSKCGILVLLYMIVGIKLERLAFGFSKRRPPLCDRGGIFNSFVSLLLLLLLFFLIVFFFSSSVLQRWPGSGLESKADIRTLTVKCLLDKPVCSKDLMFYKYVCPSQGCNRVIIEIHKVLFGFSLSHGNRTFFLFCFC